LGATIAIERRPSVAARLPAERADPDPDPDRAVRDQAVREAAEIVQTAYREVAGGWLALGACHRDGREFTGEPPGLRTVQRGPLMLVCLTDVRGERVVIIQVNWIS
jgi:hypothetical protein